MSLSSFLILIFNCCATIFLLKQNQIYGKEDALALGKIGWYLWYINPWVPISGFFFFYIIL